MTTRTINKKIGELKTYLEERLTTQETNLKKLWNNLVEKLTSELTSELKIQAEKINQLKNDKSLLQKQILEHKKENIKNRVANKDRIPTEKKDSSENVLHKVTEMCAEAGVDIPNEVFNRAHRIGPSYTDKSSNVECKSIIVRFTTFRHRTMGYWAKKKMKPGVTVKLDLTKSRYTLLADANKVVK